MKKMSVVKNSVLALAMLAIAPVFAAVTINIDPAKRGAVINKNVYGQFAEHLGAGIYEGMWVGSGSTIPNTKGWRDDVVGALKDMHVPLVRWPGGSFADEYHWKDGIGPRAERPVKVNSNWGGVEVLTAAAMDAHNTFTQEDAVKPAPFAAKAADGKLRLKIPAKAVVVVALDQ